MKPAEVKAAKGPVLQFPVAFGAITVSYNLSGVKSGLKLDGKTLGDIFLGKVKTWNDPEIKSLNPGVSLPSTSITVVHRSDSSGTTKGFTTFLAAYNPDWVKTAGPPDKTVKWPVGTGRAEERRRRRCGQADAGLDRLRRAGIRPAERIHLRRGEEQVRCVHRADAGCRLGGR